ncbi:carbon storage regulator, CsrA [Fervidobacterium changbaicum]|uniref:Translational regulator CsrA n=2 Tax=Fervidobacterium TaxID=2422 RepID=A0AAI8CKC8_FERIS|nr:MULTISPECIES: carbon storage regulator CsrA [Fervidobacterium]AMW31935.1 carbon storage regulator CsrA [Fervidobacterium islandicum]QAV33712.1 carbon storage regulator [Fervidobacterium changbaicum]SDH41058.1 carbon storage regulator, CsrA [Fervidobacterium changbaicum]
MLVLSRKVGESIIIGDNIQVKVLKVEGGAVKIGIIAPANVRIYREEIYKTIAQSNKMATNAAFQLDNVLKLKEVIGGDKDR